MHTKENERDIVIDRIQDLLAHENARRFDLKLVEAGVRKEEEWWYVPVTSGVPNSNVFDYSSVLNKIEQEFENEGTKLLLIPAIAD